jgi:hypothetical protein
MFNRNATEIRVASLEKRLARLEREAGFFTPITDAFTSGEDIVREEILHMMQGIKKGKRPGYYSVTLPNNNRMATEPNHTWQLILTTLEDSKRGEISIQILVSPLKEEASSNLLLQLNKDIFLWKKRIANDRSSIKKCLKDFVHDFSSVHPKMVTWSLDMRVIRGKDSAVSPSDQELAKQYFSNR